MNEKQNRTMLYLGTTLVLCLSAVAFLDSPESEAELKWTAAFKDFQKEDIEKIQFQSPSESIVLSRKSGKWLIESPISVTADTAKIDSILGIYEEMECSSPLKKDLAEYGLNAPHYKVTATSSKDSQTTYDIIVGDESPVSNSNYVLCIDKTPRLSRSKLSTRLRGDLDSFRMRKVLNTLPTQINSIIFPEGLEASQTESGWQQTAPFTVELDDEKISFWLKELHEIHIENFAAEKASSANSLILEGNEIHNEIEWNSSEWVASTIQKGGGSISEENFNLLQTPIDSFYSSEFYPKTQRMRTIVFRFGDEEIKASQDEDWNDAGKLHNLISTLKVNRINRIEKPANGSLTLTFEDDSSMRYAILSEGEDGSVLLNSNTEGVTLRIEEESFRAFIDSKTSAHR
ncbi:MAG: DUF4340 domain-containing protein [Myxococcota bacterium]|nr:DUF4340 domain-containing protein [Myxococcota bacterium]